MDPNEEKIGPVAILETPEGVRVAVYVVREWVTCRPIFGPPRKTLARAEYKTDGGQYVAPDARPHIARLYGPRNSPILCSITSGNLGQDACEIDLLTPIS